MWDLLGEARGFSRRKSAEVAEARQLAALRLMLGIDLGAALAAGQEEKAELVRRLERVLERERLKGYRRHWSYDLNRHIALSQALNRLRGSTGSGVSRVDRDNAEERRTKRLNGARRR